MDVMDVEEDISGVGHNMLASAIGEANFRRCPRLDATLISNKHPCSTMDCVTRPRYE
jgi:hypothetical protein